MNEFLTQAIEASGKTKADIARAMHVTPQAVQSILRNEPKPATLAKILIACGWAAAEVAAIRLGDIYNLAPTGGDFPPGHTPADSAPTPPSHAGQETAV